VEPQLLRSTHPGQEEGGNYHQRNDNYRRLPQHC
jgi:hypothetical protein